MLFDAIPQRIVQKSYSKCYSKSYKQKLQDIRASGL